MPDIYVFAQIVRNIKLDDHYWGIYLLSVFLLFAAAAGAGCFDQRQKKRFLFFGLYGALTFFPFFFSGLYKIAAPLFTESYRYQELSHLWLYPVIIPLVLGTAAYILGKKQNAAWKTAAFVFCIILLFAWSSRPVSLSFNAKERTDGFFTQDQELAYDLILEDAESRGLYEIPFWAGRDMMAKSRLYDVRLMPIYGKDIDLHPEKYSEELCGLLENYDLYEAKADHIGSKEDQLGAIANCPNIYDSVYLEYVVITDPNAQGADIDADTIFNAMGYETVGQAGKYIVYHR